MLRSVSVASTASRTFKAYRNVKTLSHTIIWVHSVGFPAWYCGFAGSSGKGLHFPFLDTPGKFDSDQNYYVL